jgi:8-oxo-dGTP pyrophosphatase MutT (NUDIX family)
MVKSIKLYFSRAHINIKAMKEELKKILSQRKKKHITNKSRTQSAVLIPFYTKDDQYYVVFIKRTDTVKYHKGQISFPGGSRDKLDETLLQTAIRESYEEIGLRRKDIEIIGELDDELTTTSNFIVTPFVSIIPYPYGFKTNKSEVAEIIEVPLKELLETNGTRGSIEILNGKTIDSYIYEYQGKIIWGATARILKKLLDIISGIKTADRN